MNNDTNGRCRTENFKLWNKSKLKISNKTTVNSRISSDSSSFAKMSRLHRDTSRQMEVLSSASFPIADYRIQQEAEQQLLLPPLLFCRWSVTHQTHISPSYLYIHISL